MGRQYLIIRYIVPVLFLWYSLLRAECTCVAKNSGTCWHVGGVCNLVQCFPRPPVVPTDDYKGWDKGKDKVSADINKPVCRLPVASHMRRAEDAKEKVLKPDLREGTGGRMIRYSCVPQGLTPRNFNDPESCKQRQALVDACRRAQATKNNYQLERPASGFEIF